MTTSAPAKVTKILLSIIRANPHNPRRLFDEEPMAVLRESIEKLGILVPITVYPQVEGKVDPDSSEFVILDGERRWRCAQELRMKRIPAIIVERPTDTENILIMFHIHNLREGWQLMPTALKLQVLMEKLGERSEKKLSVLTKLSIGQIRRCKILLSYPKKFQDLMLAPPELRLKSDFFIELDRIRKPALKENFPPWKKRGDSKCIDIILKKYLDKKIKAVTEFRKLSEIYRGSTKLRKLKQFYEELDRFFDNPELGIDSIVVPGANFQKETTEATKSASRLEKQLKRMDIEALASNPNLVTALKSVFKLIKNKLEEAMVVSRFEED